MATLNWIGKEKVINHHLDVPFRTLKHKYTYKDGKELTDGTRSENKIIHGDNLEALKSLLPEYEGKIKCIYIDPPYNTGNEGWVYNDNVNHPKIKKWLGEVVGKEGEDLTRHDKWLCMMYPRLKLLHKLLKDDGIILISIDDNEFNHVKEILDEIFGSNKFLATLIWRRRASSQMAENNISIDHEYIIAYAKSYKALFSGIDKDYKNYSNPDKDPNGDWTLGDLTVGMSKDLRPNQFYDLIDPSTGIVYKPNPNRVWTYIPESMNQKIQEGKVVFPKSGKGRPMLKRYKKDLKSSINPISTLLNLSVDKLGLNSEGTKILQEMFEEKAFDYPKPLSLITELINQVTSDSDIILDSFAGSGTTAHAVLEQNSKDNGNRKFILIELENYAENVTAQRIKNVIRGYGNNDKKIEGTGGDFDYLELGDPLFSEDDYINENQPLEDIRKYVYYSETRTNSGYSDNPRNEYYLGKKSSTAYYFYYQKEAVTTLDLEFASQITIKADQYIVYADKCTLSEEFLRKHNIIFKKIPRDITRI